MTDVLKFYMLNTCMLGYKTMPKTIAKTDHLICNPLIILFYCIIDI